MNGATKDPVILAIMQKMSKTTKKSFISKPVTSFKKKIETSRHSVSSQTFDVKVPGNKYGDIKTLMDENRNDPLVVELEASFGSFTENGNFTPGIKTFDEFVNIKKVLDTNKRFKLESSNINDTVEIYKIDNNTNIRKITVGGSERYEKKVRDRNKAVSVPELGVRISYSTENKIVDIDNFNFNPLIKRERIKRERQRTRYLFDSNGFYCYVDLTIVFQTNTRDTTYEIEIEYHHKNVQNPKETNPADFVNIIQYIYKTITSNGLTNFENISKLSFNAIKRKEIITIHNSLLSNSDNLSSTRMIYSYMNKPRNIKISDIKPNFNKETFSLKNYLPTIKLDGRRFFMLITNGECYMVLPPYSVVKFGKTLRLIKGEYIPQLKDNENIESIGSNLYSELDSKSITYLDGEFTPDYTYHVFDILFYDSKDVRKKSLKYRLKLVDKVVPYIKPYYGNILAKRYFTEGDIYKRLEDAFKEYEVMKNEDEDSVDGLIIQPEGEYLNDKTLKWKPAEQLTIDFKLNKVDRNIVNDNRFKHLINLENVERAYFIYSSSGRSLIQFKTNNPLRYNGVLILTEDQFKEVTKWETNVVECKWDKESETFVALRIRPDKPLPNNIQTAFDVWKDIHKPLKKDAILGLDFTLMRKFHNSVKKSILEKYLKKGDKIIDIGSGRGGDLGKWKSIGLEKIYTVEPNNANINEMKRRMNNELLSALTTKSMSIFNGLVGQKSIRDLENKRFKNVIENMKSEDIEELYKRLNLPYVEYINKGAEYTDEIVRTVKDNKINAIISFFSLTFFGKDDEAWQGILKTIDTIPEGAYFMGAVMDGKRVETLLNKEREILSKSTEDLNRQIEELVEKKNTIEIIKNEIQEYKEQLKYISSTSTEEAIEVSQERLKQLKKTFDPKILEKLEKAVTNRDDDYEPLEEDEGSFYNCDAFQIEQSSEFDLNSPIENEITIDIKDETSMVKEQTEYLINYNILKYELEARGFVEIEQYFLDGKEAKFLREDAYKFSSLNRAFCFKKSYNKVRTNYSIPAKGETTLLGNKFGSGLYLLGYGKDQGFINAVLQSVNTEYKGMNKNDQIAYVNDIRVGLAESLTLQKFKKLHGGELYKRSVYHAAKKVKDGDKAEEYALAEFKYKLANPDIHVAEVSLLELLSDELSVSIYVVRLGTNDFSLSRYSSPETQVNKIYNHDSSIIIATHDDFTYYSIVKPSDDESNIQYIFDSDDKIIDNIIKSDPYLYSLM